jgi:hypothetical protein
MVKLHFSIRAAIVAFLIDLVGSVLSIRWGVMHRTVVTYYVEALFLAPYGAVMTLLDHFRIFFGESVIFMLLVSGISWACIAGLLGLYLDGVACEPSNQSMKPTAPWRYNFSVFATTPCRGLSLSR